MVNIEDDELEVEAISKCVKALRPLTEDAKFRVLKYVVEKLGLNQVQANNPVTKQDENNNHKTNTQGESNNLLQNLLLGETTKQVVTDTVISDIGDLPSVKDTVIKNLHSSEIELLLVVCFYASNGSRESFLREKLIEIYRESGYYTSQRSKGLSINIQSLIKQSFIKTVSDNQYTLLSQGLEKAKDILTGRSNSKPRKPNIKKKNKPKETNND